MATVTLLKNGSGKTCDDMNKVLAYVMREAKTTHEGKKLVTGINCPAETAYTNMMLTKNYHRKTDGRMYYHLCQSFSPDEKITPEMAHKVAVEFAEKQFPGYEIVVGTHVDREHIHSHIVFNSVSFIDGKKYHSDKHDIQRWRDTSDFLCRKYGLSIVTPSPKDGMKLPGAREFRAIGRQNSWKLQLVVTIEEAMRRAKTREEFIRFMEEHGYQVTWTDTRKNITYTTPDGKKCRDNRLHETKFLKETMQNEFRIRESILRGQGGSKEKPQSSIEDNTVCDDHGSKLERTPGSISKGVGAYELNGDQRPDDGLSRPDERDLRQGSGLAGGKGTVHSEGYGIQSSFSDGEDGVTGWEDERAECFGSGENEERTEGSDPEQFGSDVSQDAPSLSSYDAFGSGARLVANALSILDTASKQQDDNNKAPRKEHKNYQKNDARGIKMGGM